MELFPTSFKQIIAAKQTGLKKDSCSTTLERIVDLLPDTPSGQCGKKLAIRILSQLHVAREKTRLAYSDTLSRVLLNLLVFVDCLRPRGFDADDLLKELP
jgi:hypothetical protein